MHHVTVIFGLILTGLGLFAYFGSASADPSVTALIPAFVGAPLLLCGLLAHQEKWRMHAMHFAAMLGLIGAIAALGRVVMKLSTLITDDPTVDKRPVRIVLAMALFCIIFEVLCVNSFVQGAPPPARPGSVNSREIKPVSRSPDASLPANQEATIMNPKPCLLLLGFLGMTAAQVNDAPATEEPPIPKQTFVYKTVGPTKIELDVYRRDGADPRPAVVWIHGGALIMGNRDGVPKDIFNVCRAQNYALFSLDYRLAPQTKLPEIIEDIQDAFRWIHTQGVSRLHVDPAKILVCGGSAGGYLTMMTGICVEPCPKALLSYWGYGDIDAAWYIEPSAFYRARPLVSREEALRSVGEGVSTGHDKNPRDKFYLYCRQNGLWTKEVAALDPKTDRQKLDRFCPVRNITPYYPPILMIHGTADTDVPYQESADMNAALTRQHVPHEFITVDGGDHGLSDRNNLAVINAHARAIAFIRKQLD